MKVEFLKQGYFKGKVYNKCDICEMTPQSANIYTDFNTVKKYFGNKEAGENTLEDKQEQNEVVDLAEYSYKKLQELCKEKNLKYTGKKDELIALLNGYDGVS